MHGTSHTQRIWSSGISLCVWQDRVHLCTAIPVDVIPSRPCFTTMGNQVTMVRSDGDHRDQAITGSKCSCIRFLIVVSDVLPSMESDSMVTAVSMLNHILFELIDGLY